MSNTYLFNHSVVYSLLSKSLVFIFPFLFSTNLLSQNASMGGEISINQSICPGVTPSTLNNVIPASGGGTSPIEYLWMTTTNVGLPVSTWNIASGTNNQASYTPSPLSVTTYFIRCARRQGFSEYIAESNIITIMILPTPTTMINGNPNNAFIGSTINFNASNSTNSTYEWDFDGDGITDCVGQNCSNTYNTPGTFTISLTVNNGSCSVTTTQTIVISNPQFASINDPCSCTNPLNFYDVDNYYVHDYVLINSSPNQTWQLSNINLANIYTNSGVPIPVGTIIPETAPGVYYLDVWFISGEGYNTSYTNNTFTFSTGTTNPCSCNNPLPVELISFEGVVDEEIVTIKWSTASEINNSHFEVERSLDGNRFELISIQEGIGNSNNIQNYSFIDDKTIPGEIYYRLKQVDYNGTYTYSETITVTITSDKIITALFPNPVKDKILMRFNENIRPNSQLEILTTSGVLIKSFTIDSSLKEMDVSFLMSGVYILRIKDSNIYKTSSIKLVKI